MKKILMVAILATSSMCAFAQKGEKSAGINLNFGTTAKNVGLGAKFQYGITNDIRIEPSLTYYFGGSGMLDITANAHYVFNIVPKFNVYPLVGIGFDMCRYETVDFGDSWDDLLMGDDFETKHETDACFKFNFGAGAEYDITSRIAMDLELRYEVITGGYSQFVIGIGGKYKF